MKAKFAYRLIIWVVPTGRKIVKIIIYCHFFYQLFPNDTAVMTIIVLYTGHRLECISKCYLQGDTTSHRRLVVHTLVLTNIFHHHVVCLHHVALHMLASRCSYSRYMLFLSKHLMVIIQNANTGVSTQSWLFYSARTKHIVSYLFNIHHLCLTGKSN